MEGRNRSEPIFYPDTPPLHGRVFCGISGGENRVETQTLLRQRMQEDEALQQNPKFWELIEAAKVAGS